MGGVGKTELALQYAIDQLQQGRYPAGICWLRARDREIATDIVNFAQVYLGLSLPDQMEIEDQVRFCWQRWPEGEALVVLDDVTDYQAIAPYLPPADPRFKLLITTRLDLGSTVQKIAIEELDEESAIALLESLVGVERVRSQLVDAQALCKWVGYLPLALELLGRFLARKLDWSIGKLLKALEDKRLVAKALVETENGMTGQLGVAAALELSWQELNEAEQELACVLGMFAIAPIPWSLVESCQPKVKPDDLEDIRDKGLMARSLLKRVGEGRYQLHQIVQEYFRIKLGEKLELFHSTKNIFCRALVEIAKTIKFTLTINQIEYVRDIITHIEEVVIQYLNSLLDEDLIYLFTGIGNFYREQGSYDLAEFWYNNCLLNIQAKLGEEHPDFATSLNNLASLFRIEGKHNKAEYFYLKALEKRKQLLGENHIDFASTSNGLAILYRIQKKYSQAEIFYLKALKIRKNLLGEDHIDVASIINNLASLYRAEGRYDEAKTLIFQALEKRKRLLGEDHPHVVQSLANLANLYCAQEKYVEAESLMQEIFEKRKLLLGEEHRLVDKSLTSLVNLYCAQEKYEKAEPLMQEIFKKRKLFLGENNYYTLISMDRLASIYYFEGKYEKAELLMQEILVKKKLLGAEHLDVIKCQWDLGLVYQKQGRYPEAKALYLQALAIAQSKLGSDHLDTQGILNCLNSLPQTLA